MARKTPLFNLITGTYKPGNGRAFFKGENITDSRPHSLTRLGMRSSFQITSTVDRLITFQKIRLALLSKSATRLNLFREGDKMQAITGETEEVLRRIHPGGESNVPAGMLP